MSNLTPKDFAILSSLVGEMVDRNKKLGKGEELELETKIPELSFEDFSKLYNSVLECKHVGKIEQTVIIPVDIGSTGRQARWNDRDVKRKEMLFENGVRIQGADRHMQKTNITRFVKGKPEEYSVKLALEKNIEPFTPSVINRYRFRFRSSIVVTDSDYPELNGWRFDFTYTRLLEKDKNPSVIQKLADFRDKFFGAKSKNEPVSVKNFLEFVPPSDLNPSFEVELEWAPDYHDKAIVNIGASVQKTKEFVNGIESMMSLVMGMIDPTYYEKVGYHQVMTEIAMALLPPREALEYKNRKTLKNIVNRPKSFSRDQWKNKIQPNVGDYYLSDKADGERAFLIMGSEYGGNDNMPGALLLTGAKVIRAEDIKVPEDYAKTGKLTICDVEVLDLANDGSSHGTVYLFDTLMYKGDKVARDPLSEREKYLNTIDRALGKGVHKKVLTRLEESKFDKQIKELHNRKERAYPIDGLIFTEARASYWDAAIWKWKPSNELTIDFLIMNVPTHLVGVKPYTPPAGHEVYWLFSGIKPSDMHDRSMSKVKGWNDLFTRETYPNMFRGIGADKIIPIQFSTPSNPYAYVWFRKRTTKSVDAKELIGRVGEFAWSESDSSWKLKNMRPDKDIEVQNGTNYGNYYKVAADTFALIKNPVTMEDLTSPIKTGGSEPVDADTCADPAYFKAQKSDVYKSCVKFNSFVVAQLLRMLENKQWIIDLGAGRGSFLFAYNGFGVKNGIFVDKDADAIDELTRRTEKFGNSSLYIYGNKPRKNMVVHTKVLDLTASAKKTLGAIDEFSPPKKGVDGAVMTFAIHYIVDSKKSLSNFIDLIDGLLAPGGVFIFTCFDGQRVFDLLRNIDTDGTWDKSEGGQLKYSIKKGYSSSATKLPDFGAKISLIHPFSEGKYYEENLINLDVVLPIFEERGFVVQQNSSFGDWLGKFRQFNVPMYESMSADDKLYSGLYQYVTVWKKIK